MQFAKAGTILAAQTLASTTSQTIDLLGLDTVALQVNYANASTAAKTFISGTYEVQTLTFPAKAAAANGDYIVAYDYAGNSYAVALAKPVAEVQTMTVPAGAAAAASKDFMILTDGSGLTWATYFDTSGTDTAPAAAAYTAVNAARKIKTDITGLAANTNIVTAMTNALNGLTDFTAAITLSGTTTLIATMAVKAPCADPVIFAADGIAAATNFSGVETTAGVASQTPTGAIWTAATHKGLADISSDTTAAQVAARAETAFNALTGFTTNITSNDGAADGTMTLTQALTPGPTTDPIPKTFNDGAAGSILGVQTTLGVVSKVDLTANTASITAHGQILGVKGQLSTSGGLPTGLSTVTDYFVIYVDANTIKFATSLANAVAGTAVDITGYGTGTQTFTPTTSTGNVIKARASIDGTYWTDITTVNYPTCPDATVTVATTTGGVIWDLQRPTFRYVSILFTPSAGQITFSVLINAKNDK